RPETLPWPRPHATGIPRHAVEPQEELGVQSVAALPGVPDGQARLSVHALGHADLQPLRLAEAVLPAAGRLRRYIWRFNARDRVAQVRYRVGQSQVRQLHGAQRLRSLGGERYLWFAEGLPGNRAGNVLVDLQGRRSPGDAEREGAPGPCLRPTGA